MDIKAIPRNGKSWRSTPAELRDMFFRQLTVTLFIVESFPWLPLYKKRRGAAIDKQSRPAQLNVPYGRVLTR